MRALRNFGERDLRIVEVDAPAAPADDEIQVRICAVALNHIDVWGWRGMAFAKRELPITVGAEASGEIIAVGKNVKDLKVGQLGALYGANTCGHCKPCLEGRDQIFATSHFAADRFTDAYRQSCRCSFTLAHDVKMVIKTCDLVNLGHRQAHLMRERGQMSRRQVVKLILDFVQMFDQKIAFAGRISEQTLHLEQRVEINDPALGLATAALFAIVDRVAVVLRL